MGAAVRYDVVDREGLLARSKQVFAGSFVFGRFDWPEMKLLGTFCHEQTNHEQRG